MAAVSPIVGVDDHSTPDTQTSSVVRREGGHRSRETHDPAAALATSTRPEIARQPSGGVRPGRFAHGPVPDGTAAHGPAGCLCRQIARTWACAPPRTAPEPQLVHLVERQPDDAMSEHEAAHVVVGAFYGYQAQHVQVGAEPYVSWHWHPAPDQKASEAALIQPVLAGPIGQDLAHGWVRIPYDSDLAPYFGWARDGVTGFCDWCDASKLLAALHPAADLLAFANRFRDHYRATVYLLGRRPFRLMVHRLATALREQGVLDREQITTIVDVDALRAAA